MHLTRLPSSFPRSVCCAYSEGERSAPCKTNASAAKARRSDFARVRGKRTQRTWLSITSVPSSRNGSDWRRACCHPISPSLLVHGTKHQGGSPVRHHRQSSAQHNHDSSKPNPFHERVQVRVDYRLSILRAATGVHDIEVA